jgi:hypothetical protein
MIAFDGHTYHSYGEKIIGRSLERRQYVTRHAEGYPVDQFDVFRYFPNRRWTPWVGDSMNEVTHQRRRAFTAHLNDLEAGQE